MLLCETVHCIEEIPVRCLRITTSIYHFLHKFVSNNRPADFTIWRIYIASKCMRFSGVYFLEESLLDDEHSITSSNSSLVVVNVRHTSPCAQLLSALKPGHSLLFPYCFPLGLGVLQLTFLPSHLLIERTRLFTSQYGASSVARPPVLFALCCIVSSKIV